MTNTKSQTFSEKLASAFNTLESRGEVIAKEYKVLANAEKHLAKRTNVFDTALGELMFELKCEQDGKRIPTSRLQDCGIHNIPKQRRADALFYVENKAACDTVAESSEKGFTNMNALVKATQKARKADEPKSDNGLSAEQIVEKALDLCGARASRRLASCRMTSTRSPIDAIVNLLKVGLSNLDVALMGSLNEE